MVCSDMSRNNFSCLDLLLHNIFETAKQILVGGFNPFEKILFKLDYFPKYIEVKIKNKWNHHLESMESQMPTRTVDRFIFRSDSPTQTTSHVKNRDLFWVMKLSWGPQNVGKKTITYPSFLDYLNSQMPMLDGNTGES